MNPYASFLGGRDAAVLVKDYPRKLAPVVERLGGDGMEARLAPGKWTVREILCHMADTEIAFSFRWRQALAEDEHLVQPFDQDRWSPRYSTTPGEKALATFLALRGWNALLLDRLEASDWERTVFHPELGRMTFRTLVEIMAGHDLNHLAQLETLASRAEARDARS